MHLELVRGVVDTGLLPPICSPPVPQSTRPAALSPSEAVLSGCWTHRDSSHFIILPLGFQLLRLMDLKVVHEPGVTFGWRIEQAGSPLHDFRVPCDTTPRLVTRLPLI